MITDIRELLVAVDEIFDNGMDIIINDYYITLVNRVEDEIDIEQAENFRKKWGSKGWFMDYNGRKAIRFYLLGDKLCDQ